MENNLHISALHISSLCCQIQYLDYFKFELIKIVTGDGFITRRLIHHLTCLQPVSTQPDASPHITPNDGAPAGVHKWTSKCHSSAGQRGRENLARGASVTQAFIHHRRISGCRGVCDAEGARWHEEEVWVRCPLLPRTPLPGSGHCANIWKVPAPPWRHFRAEI